MCILSNFIVIYYILISKINLNTINYEGFGKIIIYSNYNYFALNIISCNIIRINRYITIVLYIV